MINIDECLFTFPHKRTKRQEEWLRFWAHITKIFDTKLLKLDYRDLSEANSLCYNKVAKKFKEHVLSESLYIKFNKEKKCWWLCILSFLFWKRKQKDPERTRVHYENGEIDKKNCLVSLIQIYF